MEGGAGEAKPLQKHSKPLKNHAELYIIILIYKTKKYVITIF